VSEAQLCQGSLGDPLINISFGNGGNPGGALSAASTTYQYITTDCPQDGFYTIRSNTQSCFENTWHTVNSDHTGNAGGYFMLVNASFQPGEFYVDTVRGLCGNTTYEFASWIMNVLIPSSCNGNTIQPIITFNIEKTDGILLKTYNTGPISPSFSAIWKQFGFYFTTPASGSDIVLRIVNNAPGGCGNDLLLDDITFRPCGPKITSTVNGLPVNSVSLCEGQGGSFLFDNIVSGGFASPVFQWQQWNDNMNVWMDIPLANKSSITHNITAATPGNIRYRLAVSESGNMASSQCRIFSNPFIIQVNSNPVTSIINDGPVCEGNGLTLTASGGTEYLWSGPNRFTASGSPLTLVPALIDAGKYIVSVTNVSGCIKKDSTIVIVNPSPSVITLFTDTTICAGTSIRLSASGGNNYQWLPAAGLSDVNVPDPIASPALSSNYNVVGSNEFFCTDTAFVTVNVKSPPIADAGSDKVIFSGESVRLSGSIVGEGSYSWSPPVFIDDTNLLQPVVNPPADMRYILNVVSKCGDDSDSIDVKVYKGLFIPNAFTPNSDGINDTWNIPALGAYGSFEVFVYSRWGELVFYTKNTINPWDGKFKGSPLPMGAYNYLILTNGKKNSLRGAVILIR